MRLFKNLPITNDWRYADLTKHAKKYGGPDEFVNKMIIKGEVKGSLKTGALFLLGIGGYFFSKSIKKQ